MTDACAWYFADVCCRDVICEIVINQSSLSEASVQKVRNVLEPTWEPTDDDKDGPVNLNYKPYDQ